MRTGSCGRRGGGPAAGARWRPTRAAAATAGLFRKAPSGAGRESPKTSAPRPLRAGRAHRALKAPEGRPARGGPRRGSRRAVVEAAGSVPSDEAGAREPRGRHRPADPKRSIQASPPRLLFGAGVRPGPAPGVDFARPDSADPSRFFGRCRCPQAEVSGGRGHPRNTAPVFFATSATIFCDTASISASVNVFSVGCSVTAIATDFLSGSMPWPS